MARVQRVASVLLVLGCRPAPAGVPPPEPEPPRTPDALVEAEMPATPEVQPTPRRPAPRPEWMVAALEDRVGETFVLRTKRKTVGDLLETPDGGVLAAGQNGQTVVIAPLVVIDDDRSRAKRRPRILCSSWRHAVAAYVDAGDLFDLAAGEVFASAEQPRPGTVDATTVGFHLEAGAVVDPVGDTPDRVRIHYSAGVVEASGWVDEGDVDVVYEEAKPDWPDPGHVTHIVTRRTTVYDAADGKRFGTITPGEGQVHVTVHRSTGKRSLVTLRDWAVQLTGWVAAKDLRKPKEFSYGLAGGGWGSGSIGASATVTLPRGTVLLGPESSEVIGVVTRESTYPCTDCDSSRPRITLRACEQLAEVIADRDDQRND